MAEIRVTLPNIPEASTADIERILTEGAEAIINTARLAFVDASTPTGEPWPTLSEATRRKRGQDAKPLRDTGRLMNSLLASVSGSVATIGSNLIYSRIHNDGGNAGRNHMTHIPQRRYIPDPDNLPADLSDELHDIAVRHLGRIYA